MGLRPQVTRATDALTAAVGNGRDPGPAVSVVVTVRNEEARLPTLLAAIDRQTLPRNRFQLVIVDDASRDATAAMAIAHQGAIVIALPSHSGLAAGRNAGIRASTAPLIALTDADCCPADDWLERGVQQVEELGADILAGGITMPLGPRPSIAALVDATVHLNQEAYVQTGYGAGANLWIRREVFERVGLFNQRIGLYGDDADLCRRALASGARFVYAPDVYVVHRPRSRVRELVRKAFLQGFCLSAQRRFGTVSRPYRDPLFLQWRQYLPPRGISGTGRLIAQLFVPSRRQIAGIYVGQYVLVRLPKLLGDVIGELRHARATTVSPSQIAPETPARSAFAEVDEPLRLDPDLPG